MDLVTELGIAKLLNALTKLDKLLDKYRIGYIVIGSLADHILGIYTIKQDSIDILVDKENVKELNTVFQQEQGIVMLESIRWRENSTIRGLYGRALLESISWLMATQVLGQMDTLHIQKTSPIYNRGKIS